MKTRTFILSILFINALIIFSIWGSSQIYFKTQKPQIERKTVIQTYLYRYNKINENNLSATYSNKIIEVNIPQEKNPNYIIERKHIIDFYANSFQISENYIIENIIKDEDSLNDQELEKKLFNTIMELQANSSDLFQDKLESNTKSKEYILGLIEYFALFYPIVDLNIAKAIADVESGFTSKNMLKCNNIYGGISKGKLIHYKTIEYGVFKYIKLLNDGYYEKGLNTVYDIGKKFNPLINENGEKIPNPLWVDKVNNVLEKYPNNNIDSIKKLILL